MLGRMASANSIIDRYYRRMLGGFKGLGRFIGLSGRLGSRQDNHVIATLVVVRVVICRCLCTLLFRSWVAQSSLGAEQTSPEFLEHLHRST